MMKKYFLKIAITYLTLIFANFCLAEELKQTISGRVLDATSNQFVENALIQFEGADQPIAYVQTDSLGYFSYTTLIGNYRVTSSRIAYLPQQEDVVLNTATELYLVFKMQRSITTLDEVSIIASVPKYNPINTFAFAGVSKFNTDEVSRYAGSLGDPARMVRSYAGVSPVNDERNDLVIRGNSPIGVQWRVDGIEIGNPNHYAGVGLTGGRVTLLNLNLLANSDFYMGAWTADIGNATSGVFDVQLRSGNKKRLAAWAQSGWNGVELGVEGPVGKKKETTFIANYRYSFLDLMQKIGFKMDLLPKYQDATFKVNLEKKNHQISFLGLWGTSAIQLIESDTKIQGSDITTSSDALIVGVNDKWQISRNSNIELGASLVRNEVATNVLDFKNKIIYDTWDEQSVENKWSLYLNWIAKLSSRNTLKAGVKSNISYVNYQAKSSVYSINDNADNYVLYQAFAENKYRPNDKLTFVAGVHTLYLALNNSLAIEPRLGAKYAINRQQSIGFGGGVYNQMQPAPLYFVRTPTAEGAKQTNIDLGFTKSVHLDLNYTFRLSDYWIARSELYYQKLSSIPVENKPESIYSTINVGADDYIVRHDSLINQGKGNNYGLELTLERFLHHNYYLLTTVTLYQSKYNTGFNNSKTYNTAFNGNYIVNFSGGYEWKIKNYISLLFDLKGTYAGGQRYVPIDELASVAANEIVYNTDQAYLKQYPSYFRVDFKVGYRLNLPKLFFDFALDLQNITNQKNIYKQTYDPSQNFYNIKYQQGLMPMLTVKCQF